MRRSWLRRLLAYGAAGWLTEVVFTGVGSGLSRDRSLRSTTYLWMLPIYGAGGLLLETSCRRLRARGAPRAVRAAAYVPLILGLEYASGWLLRRLLGQCPWDYGQGGLSFAGLVRLDYAPFWYGSGLLFEELSARLDRVLGGAPAALPAAPPPAAGTAATTAR